MDTPVIALENKILKKSYAISAFLIAALLASPATLRADDDESDDAQTQNKVEFKAPDAKFGIVIESEDDSTQKTLTLTNNNTQSGYTCRLGVLGVAAKKKNGKAPKPVKTTVSLDVGAMTSGKSQTASAPFVMDRKIEEIKLSTDSFCYTNDLTMFKYNEKGGFSKDLAQKVDTLSGQGKVLYYTDKNEKGKDVKVHYVFHNNWDDDDAEQITCDFSMLQTVKNADEDSEPRRTKLKVELEPGKTSQAYDVDVTPDAEGIEYVSTFKCTSPSIAKAVKEKEEARKKALEGVAKKDEALTAQNKALQGKLDAAQSKIAEQEKTIADLKAQLAAVPAPKTKAKVQPNKSNDKK